MRRWRPEHIHTEFEHPLLDLEIHTLKAEAPQSPERAEDAEGAGSAANLEAQVKDERRALVLEMPGWVNIMALTAEQEVLLVRQWRFGIRQMTLEIPGGLIEKGEEERVAAERELYEETGYRAKSWQYLGAVHPNPAIQSNQIGTWLATDLVQIGEPPGDGDEELEVVRLPLEQIPQAILSGEITHSLVVAAFYLFDQQRSSLSL